MTAKPLTTEILANQNLNYQELKITTALEKVIDTLADRIMKPDNCDPVIHQSISNINEQKLFLHVTGPENLPVFENFDKAEAYLKAKVREKIRELNPPNAHDCYKQLNEKWIKFRLIHAGIQDLPYKRVVYQRICDVTPTEQIRLLSAVLAKVPGRKVTDEILTETAAKLKITLPAKKERTPAPDLLALARTLFAELLPHLSAAAGYQEQFAKLAGVLTAPKSKSKSRGSQSPASGGPTIPSKLLNAPPIPKDADPSQDGAHDDKKLDTPITPQAPATAADQPVAVVESTMTPADDSPAPLPSVATEAEVNANGTSPAPAAPGAEGTAKSAEAPTPTPASAEEEKKKDTPAADTPAVPLEAPATTATPQAVGETTPTATPAPSAQTAAPTAADQKPSLTPSHGIPVQFAADPAKRELYLYFIDSTASAHIAKKYKFKSTRDDHGTFRGDGFRFDTKLKEWYWIIPSDVDFAAKSAQVQRALADAGANVEVIAPRVAA